MQNSYVKYECTLLLLLLVVFDDPNEIKQLYGAYCTIQPIILMTENYNTSIQF